jgi:ferredoxin-NADP reductase/predicted pyridoxine 5'-phosphate oxidase superfamily flavin-nucleotide-binding protein
MAHSYHEIAFTPNILDLQTEFRSRDGYAGMGSDERYAHQLSANEAEFIARRDSVYMASVGETGWPYLQHRGGPVGFMKVLDECTIGFADYSGNRQYVSTGNFMNDDRVSLFFMDYPNRRRLKMFGRVRIVDTGEEDILKQLEDADFPAQIERGFIITVEGFDWNCPAHITPRFTAEEIRTSGVVPLQDNQQLQTTAVTDTPEPKLDSVADGADRHKVLGDGPLELVISGIRQLTPDIRAYELRHPEGEDLQQVEAGAHLVVPVHLATGEITEKHYSIASDPAQRDEWQIAVLREGNGSQAIHDTYQIGTTLRVAPPANHFALHPEARNSVLIAGGIGITPIKAMAQTLVARDSEFELHYAGRSLRDMAFHHPITKQLGERANIYSRETGTRMDIDTILAAAPEDTIFYVCGPERLTTAVLQAASVLGLQRNQVRMEVFS